jgi:hypothetical protein
VGRVYVRTTDRCLIIGASLLWGFEVSGRHRDDPVWAGEGVMDPLKGYLYLRTPF